MNSRTTIKYSALAAFGSACVTPAPPPAQPFSSAATPAVAQATAAPPLPTAPAAPSAPSCSLQYQVPLVVHDGATGAWGTLRSEGQALTGWMLFDTGANGTLFRHPSKTAKSSTWHTHRAELQFGAWRDITQEASLDVGLWGKHAPASAQGGPGVVGAQIGVLGTVVMMNWAVRLESGSFYFSDSQSACTEMDLAAKGFVPLSSHGFYQRDPPFCYTNKAKTNLAPAIPTVDIELLGERVKAQIDTGYADSCAPEVQINDALYNLLKSKLGSSTGSVDYGYGPYPVFTPSGAAIRYIDTSKLTGSNCAPSTQTGFVATVQQPRIVHKNDPRSGGIAEWELPAAMLSASAFVRAFSSVEFRADHARVWVKP